jgi:acid phosphatase type 7
LAHRLSGARRLAALLGPVLLVAACASPVDVSPSALSTLPASGSLSEPPPSRSESGSPAPAEVATIIAAGDIAGCEWDEDSATAALIAEREVATVLTLGDNVYDEGSDLTYARCYDPTWGEFLDRTRPAIGNHDVQGDGGAAYFRYFGEAAGNPGEGWYSFDLGEWHLVALNSNCTVVGCDRGSPQYEWLVGDLAASDARCTLAYWHHPRFSSGPHGSDPSLADLWRALDEGDADVVLAGHDHLYERFAPQTADGAPAPDGVRQFTVGTGGAELYEVERDTPNSELAINTVRGVLVLRLEPTSYAWAYLTIDEDVPDSGERDCV